jgi:predicted ATPase
VRLSTLGFDEMKADGDRVAILVGPNGTGKSRALRALAQDYDRQRDIVIVSNAAHDRFKGMRSRNRLSFGRGGDSAKSIIKAALAKVLDEDGPALFNIRAVLEYCGYDENIGFLPHIIRWDSHILRKDELAGREYRSGSVTDADRAVGFIQRSRPGEISWAGTGSGGYDFSSRESLAALLRSEAQLRREGVISRVEVFLQKHGRPILLNEASSGELSLISSLIFLIATAPSNAIVLIDEPENSLHPSWQREYVDKVLAALNYRNASVIIATHSPLVVTGALTHDSPLTTVFRVGQGQVEKLDIATSSAAPNSIEEVLWKAFEVVTPANHFVSEEIVEAIDAYERGRRSKADVIELVRFMQRKSDDRAQQDFFRAVLQLIDRVERRKNPMNAGAGGDD